MSIAATKVWLMLGPERSAGVSELPDRLAARGVAAQVIPAPRDSRIDASPPLDLGWTHGLLSAWRRPWTVRRLARFEEIERPHLLDTRSPALMSAVLSLAERVRLPYVATISDYPAPEDSLRVSRRWCRRLIVPSLELADFLCGELGVPAELLSVIPPGLPTIGTPRLRPREVPAVGTIASWHPRSGLNDFLTAARRVIDMGLDAEFLIGGQGPMDSELRRRASRLGLADRVTLTDFPSDDSIIWSTLDVYCQPAIQPAISRPLSLALACGIPVIASEVEGLRSLVQSGTTGLLVPPRDPERLAAALADLLRQPEQAQRLGEAGRAAAQSQFDPERECDSLVALYREIADQGE